MTFNGDVEAASGLPLISPIPREIPDTREEDPNRISCVLPNNDEPPVTVRRIQLTGVARTRDGHRAAHSSEFSCKRGIFEWRPTASPRPSDPDARRRHTPTSPFRSSPGPRTRISTHVRRHGSGDRLDPPRKDRRQKRLNRQAHSGFGEAPRTSAGTVCHGARALSSSPP